MEHNANVLLNQKQVMRLVNIGSRETLSRWVRRGLFPIPLRVGGGRLRWLEIEIIEWIARRAAARKSADAVSQKVVGSPRKRKVARTAPADLLSWIAAPDGEQ